MNPELSQQPSANNPVGNSDETLHRYKKATEDYFNHLKASLLQQFNSLSKKETLAIDFFSKSILLQDKKLNLRSREEKDALMQALNNPVDNLISSFLKSDDEPRLFSSLENATQKHPILYLTVLKAREVAMLNTALTDESTSPKQRIDQFHHRLETGKSKANGKDKSVTDILTTRRDGALMTFAKACGFILLGILGLATFGYGTHKAYHGFFGNRASRGHEFMRETKALPRLR